METYNDAYSTDNIEKVLLQIYIMYNIYMYSDIQINIHIHTYSLVYTIGAHVHQVLCYNLV